MIKLIDLIREDISASEAYDDVSSMQSIADGKRNVGFLALYGQSEAQELKSIIQDNNLKVLKVNRPSSPNEEVNIVYRPGSEAQAKELRALAEKYDGYLAWYATEEDTRKIGQLLGYRKSDVEDYIKNHADRQEDAEQERQRKGIK